MEDILSHGERLEHVYRLLEKTEPEKERGSRARPEKFWKAY